MTMKRAPSKVRYNVNTYNPPAIYPLAPPVPATVTPLLPDLIYEHASSIFRIEANANEDFNLPLQLTRLNIDGSEAPIDLGTSPILEFVIRPRFDHSAIIKKLTAGTGSDGAGIVINDGTSGLITLYMPQAVVGTTLLVSKTPAEHWNYFFNWTIPGTAISELFRGPLIVHAGRYP
jgi:hypothetical protein